MKPFEQGNEWMKLWSDNQKSLFEAWVQGKPPPFAFRGEAPPAGDAMNQAAQISDLMRQSMEQRRVTSRGLDEKYLLRNALYEDRINAIIAVKTRALT